MALDGGAGAGWGWILSSIESALSTSNKSNLEVIVALENEVMWSSDEDVDLLLY